MGKLVVLKIIDGSFDRGFTTMLQIGQEGERPQVETIGKLPPLPELPLLYQCWRDSYWRLDCRYRLSAKRNQLANVSLVEDCVASAQGLKSCFNSWLLAEEFRPIREKWLECLTPDEHIRVILQTEDSQLRQLPWNLLDLLERYPRAELALSTLNMEAPPKGRSPDRDRVKILAVMGSSEGIDTEADRALLASLPDGEVLTLVEPDRQQLNDALWNECWDMLFFAGHSASRDDRETGRIFLNPTDSLSLSELKYALRRSVEQGLQLAIFNSCDGLGLARELADLHIPQVIVMREPVPDRVAQDFLQHLLSVYAAGMPLYLAVRQARERLQGLEHRFPCASWLPLICQHPAVIPPSWDDFTIASAPTKTSLRQPNQWWAIAVACSLIATTLVSGIRAWGWLQPLELAAFDQMTRLRPAEPPDPRLVVVTIDDEDLRLQRQSESLQKVSISDRNLSRLLELITHYRPAAIGLDIYRDEKTKPTYPKLAAQLQNNPNLIAICKVGYDKANPYGIQASPDIPPESFRVGFSDFILDRDDVVRRDLLAMPIANQTESRCRVPTAFSVELALRYLHPYIDADQTGFAREWQEQLKIRLAKSPIALPTAFHAYMKAGHVPASDRSQVYEVLFPQLRSQPGAYQGGKTDTHGTQMLLNYRATRQLDEVATSQPLRWFLSETNPPDAEALRQLIHGKVVLIGVTAREVDDVFKTPFGSDWDERIAGVFVHAHKVSQLVSAVLDDRPLLWTWTPWIELLWVGSWGLLGGGLTVVIWGQATPVRRLPYLGLMMGLVTIGLYVGCAAILIGWGGWIPVVPSVLALMGTSAGVTGLMACYNTKWLK